MSDDPHAKPGEVSHLITWIGVAAVAGMIALDIAAHFFIARQYEKRLEMEELATARQAEVNLNVMQNNIRIGINIARLENINVSLERIEAMIKKHE